MIKGVKPSGRYKSGVYKVVHESKHFGKEPIIYRSSWEHKFCMYCDANKNIIKWCSEELEIPYFSKLDNKWHRYYPDFYIEIKKGDKIFKYVIEVKPKGDLLKPRKLKRTTEKQKKQYNYKAKTYYINTIKAKFAKEYCIKRGWKYVYVTEDWNKYFK